MFFRVLGIIAIIVAKYDGAKKSMNQLYVISLVFISIALMDQFKYVGIFIAKGISNIISITVYLLTDETFP